MPPLLPPCGTSMSVSGAFALLLQMQWNMAGELPRTEQHHGCGSVTTTCRHVLLALPDGTSTPLPRVGIMICNTLHARLLLTFGGSVGSFWRSFSRCCPALCLPANLRIAFCPPLTRLVSSSGLEAVTVWFAQCLFEGESACALYTC